MEIKGVGQNVNNIAAYSSNAVSEYTQTNTEGAVPQVKEFNGIQKTEAKPSEVNGNKNEEYNKKDLDNALKKINNFMKDEHTRAEYSYHKDFGTLMIKIVNEDTKEVLLEVPPKRILDMVASMCRQVGLLDKKA